MFSIRTTVQGARIRSSADFSNNIIKTVAQGTVFNADQAAAADWYALTDQAGYIHRSVAEVYAPPVPVPLKYIPYFSQEDMDAKKRNNDCGPACVKMLLGWRGIQVAIDDIWEPDPTGLSTCFDLVKNLAKYGVASEVQALQPGLLPPYGAICLIWYGAFARPYVQQKSFTGQHFVVFMYPDNQNDPAVIVHDPDYYGDIRQWGAYHRYPRDQWDKAQTNCDPSRQIVVLK